MSQTQAKTDDNFVTPTYRYLFEGDKPGFCRVCGRLPRLHHGFFNCAEAFMRSGSRARKIYEGDFKTGDFVRVHGKVRQVLATYPGAVVLAYLGGGPIGDGKGKTLGRIKRYEDEAGNVNAQWLNIDVERITYRDLNTAGAEVVKLPA